MFGNSDEVPDVVSRVPVLGIVKTYIEEMELVYCAPNAIGKQQNISCRSSAARLALR